MMMKMMKMKIKDFNSKVLKKNLKKHKNFFLAFAGIIFISVLSEGLYHFVIGPNKAQALEGLSIQTVRVKNITMPITVDTVGTLLPLHEAKLTAAMTGKVDKVLVPSGSKVKKGTALLSVVGMANIFAPFDGFLTDWKIKPGEYVTSGTELIDIVNTEQLLVHYRIPEQFAPSLENDQKISLTVRAFPKREFSGTVNYIAPHIDRKTHTVLLHALVNNTDEDLWPGMFVHLRHILSVENNAFVIPESTLTLTLEGYEILVVKENKLVRKTVTVGSRDKGRAHILSGLSENDQVLLTKTDATKEGTVVIAKDWTGDW